MSAVYDVAKADRDAHRKRQVMEAVADTPERNLAIEAKLAARTPDLEPGVVTRMGEVEARTVVGPYAHGTGTWSLAPRTGGGFNVSGAELPQPSIRWPDSSGLVRLGPVDYVVSWVEGVQVTPRVLAMPAELEALVPPDQLLAALPDVAVVVYEAGADELPASEREWGTP